MPTPAQPRQAVVAWREAPAASAAAASAVRVVTEAGAAGGAGGAGGGAGGMRGGGGGGRGGPGALGDRLALANRMRQDLPHGNASYTLGGSPFDAAPYALNGRAVTEPTYLQQRFGGSIGGQFKIPHLFDLGSRTLVLPQLLGQPIEQLVQRVLHGSERCRSGR